MEAQVRILKHQFGKKAFVNYEEKRIVENHLYWGDSGLFSLFDITMFSGDTRTALTRENVKSPPGAEGYFTL